MLIQINYARLLCWSQWEPIPSQPVARLNNAGTMNKISPSFKQKKCKQEMLGGDQTREACTLEQKTKREKSCAYRAYGDQPLERSLSRRRDEGRQFPAEVWTRQACRIVDVVCSVT